MKKTRREIQRLIMMIGSAIFAAFVVVAALVFSFGSSKDDENTVAGTVEKTEKEMIVKKQ